MSASPSRKARPQPAESPTAAPPAGTPTAPRQVTVHEAKTHLSRLLKEVEAGESVVITRRGKPVAKLEAAARPKRVRGSMKGMFSIDERFFEPLPEEELRLWNCE